MPNSDFQRHSFLGGEVSPSLYERADMEKFGKWFSKAENIRFRETGAFRTRNGFIKIADTKNNLAGQVIKLLSFEFNDEESFLVELGPNYARFFRNGSPIMDGDAPYELQTAFASFGEEDLKYAQAGDTIFITHPQYGIYELARLQANGSAWEFKKFNTDILPMKEENDNKNKTVSLSAFTQDVKTLDLSNPDSSNYLNVSFTFDSSVVYTAVTATLQEIFAGITEAIGSNYRTSLDGTTMNVIHAQTGTVPDFSISFDTQKQTQIIEEQTSQVVFPSFALSTNVTATTYYTGWSSLDDVTARVYYQDPSRPETRYLDAFNGTLNVSGDTIADSIQEAVGYGHFNNISATYDGITYTFNSNGIVANTQNNNLTLTLNISSNISPFGDKWLPIWVYLKISRNNIITSSYTRNSITASALTTNYYALTSVGDVFAKVDAPDCVLVKHAIDSQQLKDSYSAAGAYTLGPIKSDGNWRLLTLGNWAGEVVVQYSTDNKQTWVDYYKWASQDANDTPANINTSGSLIADDLVWFRVVSTVTSTGTKPLQITFVANSFSVNSYYKIVYKNNSNSVIAECVKNDVGTFSSNSKWRLPAFSMSEGWPQTVAFYQNRLFFGKDYIVYGSRSNDFWDFYEPIKLQADDPITMSLLSQKVNSIRNLLTQRSFFTFTAGGEFGIGSEGALTQSDKYLKPFSSNGSAQCSPVLISDVVLFVDKSYNTVRALKYSLESDGYEAPDITITLKALLENEKIISTDIIYEEKEALFLSDTGTIWVLKYITDQNVLSWSHWEHAFGKITNICVVPNGPKHDLYIAVEANGKKWIEKMSRTEFMDTVEYFDATNDSKVTVTGVPGSKKVILQGNKRYFKTIDENNQIDTPDDHTTGFKVGSSYVSTATLLSPVIQLSDYSHSNYELKNPFKVFFYYLNSYGFKVGVEEDEKMEIEWQPVNSDIDDEINLTSGKKSVLIPSRFDGSARVTFEQQEPFPMEVADTLIQTDVGGK